MNEIIRDALSGAVKSYTIGLGGYIPIDKRQGQVDNIRDMRLGAFVRDPISGIIKWISSFDANSLYPNDDITFNISPDTYIPYHSAPQEIRDMIESFDLNVWEYRSRKLTIKEIASQYKKDTGISLPPSYFNLSKRSVEDALYKDILTAAINIWVERDYLEKLKPLLQKYDLVFCPNLTFFVRTFQGIVPAKMEQLYSDRVVWNERKDSLSEQMNGVTDPVRLNELETEKNMADLFSDGLKRLLNSGYGGLSNPHLRFSDVNLTNAITSSAQYLLKSVAHYVNKYQRELFDINYDTVIYGDTDSLYVTFAPAVEWLKKKLNKENIEIDEMKKYIKLLNDKIEARMTFHCEILHAYKPNILKMKLEKVGDSSFFQKRKRYCVRVLYDSKRVYPKPKIKATGLSLKNINMPKIVNTWAEKAFHYYLNQDQEGLRKFIKQCKQDYMKQDLRDISFIKTINLMEKYIELNSKHPSILGGNYRTLKRCLPPIKGAAYHNFLITKGLIPVTNEIRNGDKVYMMYLKPKVGSEVAICYKETEEITISRNKIDFELMFEKQFLACLKPFQSILNWNLSSSLKDILNARKKSIKS